MDDAVSLRSYDLPSLSKQVKEIWPHSHNWRLNEGRIEFSLPCTDGEEWFHVSRSPDRVYKFVRAWYRSGGLNKP